MLFITYEGTYLGWTIVFVFMAFASLFNTLDKKEEEITALRARKDKDN